MLGFVPLNLMTAARAAAKSGFAMADEFFPVLSGPRLLIYHQIGAGLGRQMEVTKQCFESHLSWLMANKEVVDLETAIARRGETGAKRLVVLTFDDGFEDLFRIGFPLMAANEVPFVLYVTTGPVETQQPFGRVEAIPLSWDQIEEMSSSGLMTLGVHTHSHPDLRLLTRSEIADELSSADALIELRTGRPPRHFAYPYGYWAAAADAEVRQRYSSAVLGAGGQNTLQTDPFLLHRIPIQLSDGILFFRRKVETGLRLEEKARRLLTGYRGP
jgi:peptidoglycan/xylan/chitin deacetylase (PgdA/CDA1 family)